MKKALRLGLLLVLGLGIFGSIVPYFIPLSSYQDFGPEDLFRESYVEEVDGLQMHYRIWLPEEQPLGKVLLVHGLGGSTFSWNNNVGYLRDSGYVVVAVDLPGFGYSSRNPNIDHSQQHRSYLLWKLLGNLDRSLIQDISGGWILAGHSMGGGTVAAMAIDDPNRTQALVMVDAALSGPDRTLVGWALKYPPVNRWFQVVLRHVLINEKNIEKFLTSAYGRNPSSQEVSGYLHPLMQPGTDRTLVDFAKTASHVDVDPLATLAIPILGIWGEHDSWVPLEEGERIKQLVPKMDLKVIPGAVHCPMETHPDEFNKVFVDFLAKMHD